jgi:hypothetical protein
VTKLSKYMYEGPSDKSVFIHGGFCKISLSFCTPIILSRGLWKKYQFLNKNGNIYLCLHAPLFQFSVRWSSEMQFGLIYLKTWASTQPPRCILDTWISFLFLDFKCNMHNIKFPSLPKASVCCILCQVFLVGWWMGLSGGVSSKHLSCLLY